jgi:Ca2+-binding RTX toxin-like protein
LGIHLPHRIRNLLTSRKRIMATYTGTSGNDTLTGSGSDDTINGLGGSDLLIGGDGNDSYYVDQSGDQILELSAQGTDIVYASASYQLGDQLENLVLTGFASIEATGNILANSITGNAGNNTLTGLGGNDILDGGLGHDIAVYSAASSGYEIGVNGGQFTVKDILVSNGNEGTDTLRGIEQIAFSDGALSVSRLYTEFRVNSHTSYGQSDPSISKLADGGFIAAWVSFSQDGALSGIYAQRYAADGSTQGEEFRVNESTTTSKTDPHVTALADGGFVITWVSNDSDDNGVFAQRYDADGTARGNEFMVNSVETADQDKHSITALSDGGFVIAWTSLGEDGDVEGIFAQRYDAEGNPVGNAGFQVNTETSSLQYAPSISSLADGGFIISWVSNAQDGSSTGIYAQRYDAEGDPFGVEFIINATTTGGQYAPSITGLADGGFVVTWTSTDGNGEGVYSRVYDAAGNTSGADVRVNVATASNQSGASVAALEDGGYIVTWSSNLQDGDDSGIYARLYTADGTAAGTEFLVNSTTLNGQTSPSVAALEDGGFIITWQSESAIYSQRYAANGTILYSVTGDAGNNTLSFVGGSARLAGGLGNDTYVVDDANDTVSEAFNAGSDTVKSSVSYALSVNVENLTLSGGAAINATGNNLANKLIGNTGSNTLDGGLGNDTMTGGLGNDTYIVSATGDKVVEAASGGTDTVITSVNHTLAAQVENLQIISASGRSVAGNNLNNIITGGYGNDTLNGGTGVDSLRGGLGNDTYVIDTTTDTLTENASAGTDTVRSSVTYTLKTNFENLTLTGGAAINGKGNGVANALTGNTGANILSGLAGNDTLNGSTGKDTLTGGAGLDNFLFNTALSTTLNVDTITDFVAADDTIRLENAIFTKLTANGVLNAAFFKANLTGNAVDSNDYITYETDTGKLFYDADGNGAGAKVQFALLGTATHPGITAADFVVI